MWAEELLEYVRCVCVWPEVAWVESVVSGLGLGFTNHVGTCGVFWVAVVWGVGRGIGPGSGGVGWCYVYVSCESGFSVWMAGICILFLADTCAS